METYFNATSGKYGLVELKERYKDIRLPHIELVDIKELAHQTRMQGPDVYKRQYGGCAVGSLQR